MIGTITSAMLASLALTYSNAGTRTTHAAPDTTLRTTGSQS